MLRKRSRAVTTTTTKQPIVSSDHNNNNNSSCPSSKPTTFISAHSIVERFMSPFKYETAQKYPAMMMMVSPSSVLDTKPFFSSFPTAPLWLDRKMFLNHPFKTSSSPDKRNEKTTLLQKRSWDRPGIGIALIDDDDDENRETEEYKKDEVEEEVNAKQGRRNNLIVFGSHLRIQIPPHPMILPNSHILQQNSPISPVEFGTKTPRSNLGVLGMRNRVEAEKKDQGGAAGGWVKLKESISIDKMELSEDYTCVISHGPNPKTTHIFGNCVVESSCVSPATNRNGASFVDGDRVSVRKERESKGFDDFSGNSERDDSSGTGDFLSFCHHCKKRLGHGRDIYMYRGEKAFCSEECRGQGMLFDGVEC